MNKRALSPVVATIIIVAIAIVVSIAVAVWIESLGVMPSQPPAVENIWVNSWNTSPRTINITITNSGSSTIYPDSLLVDNATAFTWPIVAANNLSVGKSDTRLINYNWTYNTGYTFTFVWHESNNKQYNCSIGPFLSPPIPNVLNLPIPAFDNATYAIWTANWNFENPDMLILPANITIDTTGIRAGTQFEINIKYYHMQTPSLFEYLGEQDYLLIVPIPFIVTG